MTTVTQVDGLAIHRHHAVRSGGELPVKDANLLSRQLVAIPNDLRVAAVQGTH